MIKTLCLDAIYALYNFFNPIVEQRPTESPFLLTIELTNPLTMESLTITGTPCFENKDALEIHEVDTSLEIRAM
ncbi:MULTISPECIES: hypothetical protein [Pseudomonas]|uniref:Uncharacterized protein n=1 Tax=Pseudomonas fulva TaxID=47880 RepID=A0A0D0L104_9PSED|nr:MULTISPECIES: hypothetical protein [Pseudomonas]KIQ06070.1 hypothetical protein RU08_02450 [Pseudomonas fulva]